jgi:hypothetical protein
MLAVSSYHPDHVQACRTRMAADIAAFEAAGAPAALEPVFCAALVLALDHWFLHRQRSLEGKDGNALNEVRVLCDSIVEHGGTLTVDKSTRLRPETSVLGLAPGDAVVLDLAGFRRLAEAFLAEIERRYP